MEPVVPARNEWDDALARVMAFLAKLQLSDLEHRVRSATRIIDKARFEIVPGESPVEKSMERSSSRKWTSGSSGVLPVPGSRGTASGVVSLRALRASERWPEAFLDGEPSEEIRPSRGGLSPRRHRPTFRFPAWYRGIWISAPWKWSRMKRGTSSRGARSFARRSSGRSSFLRRFTRTSTSSPL